jgi:hypothetical protein
MTWEPPSAGWREVYYVLDVPPPERGLFISERSPGVE